MKNLSRRLPILQWLPNYRPAFLFSDFLAGVTVSLTVIPQGIAYAAVAGLPLQYGLYTAFMAPFMLVFFSTVPEITMGPTAVMAIMTLQYASTLGPEVSGLLSFLSGICILLCGLLNLGFLTELISGTVLSAFCSAAATRVILMQIRTLLGLRFLGNGFISVLIGICERLQEVKVADFALGFLTIVILIVLKNLSSLLSKCSVKNETAHRVAWLLSVSRNALVITAGCITGYILSICEKNVISLTGYIEPGIPEFKVPSFSFNLSNSHSLNSTMSTSEDFEILNFIDSLQHFGLGLVLISVVSVLEHVAIAKSVSSGVRIDSSQELVSLGVANLVGSFVGAFPVTASFSRSAVQKASGAKTPLCNLFTGSIVLLSIAFLTETFYYIPKVSLASVIVCAVAPMIEFKEIGFLWKVSRIELVPFFTTFFVCLLVSIESGIIAGALLHLLFVAFHFTRKLPSLSVNQESEVVIVAQRSLYFSGIEMLRSTIESALAKQAHVSMLIDMKNVHHIDATSLKTLEGVFDAAYSKGSTLNLVNLTPKVRATIVSGLGIKSFTRRLPVLHWLPKYQLAFLFSDFLAGVTVSLTVIPQGIAYAAVAGLPLEYGLYTAFMAPFMLVLFSTIPEVTMGPTAVMAIMSLQYVVTLGPGAAGLLSFLAGILIFIFGLFNLGFLTELISGTVLSGFCSAAASTVLLLQIRTLMGLSFPGNTFITVVIGICDSVRDTRLTDFTVGLLSIALLVFLKNLSFLLSKCKVKNELALRVAWIVTVSRNAVAIGLGCVTSYLLYGNENFVLSLTGHIEAGIPEFTLPSFTFNLTGNSSLNSLSSVLGDTQVVSFIGCLRYLGPGMILIAVVSVLEHIAISKTVSSGVSIDSSQELCSLGIANLFGSLVGAFPVTASFARSAVQKASGAKTPLCNLFTGSIVLLSIAFLTEYFRFIPKVSLAAVIACAVAPMIEFEEVLYLWRVSKKELIPFFTTFIICLVLSIEAGIISGAALHILLTTFHTTRNEPNLSVNEGESEVVVTVQRSLYFSGIEILRNSIEEVLQKKAPVLTVVDMVNVHHADATSLKTLERIFDSAHSKGTSLRIVNMKPKIRSIISSGLGESCILLKGYNDQEMELLQKVEEDV